MKGTREVTFVKMYMIEDHAQCLNSHISHTVTGFLMYIKAIFKIALQKIHCMHKLFLNGYFLINFNVLEKKLKYIMIATIPPILLLLTFYIYFLPVVVESFQDTDCLLDDGNSAYGDTQQDLQCVCEDLGRYVHSFPDKQ